MTKKYIIVEDVEVVISDHLGNILIDEDNVEEVIRSHSGDYYNGDDVIDYVKSHDVVIYEVSESFKMKPPSGKILNWAKQ